MRSDRPNPHESRPSPRPANAKKTRADKQKGKQDTANRKERKPGRRRAGPRGNEVKRDAAKDAAKKHHKKEALSKTNRTEYSFVYVGNIDPTITGRRLQDFFSTCGKVCRVQLRCSRGQAITIGVAVPEDIRTKRDRQYASIEFEDYRGARNALRLNGEVLDGCELVVSITPTDLPEVQDIVNTRISEIKNRVCRNNASHNVWHAERPLVSQPTEEVMEGSQLGRRDRHRVLDVSFGKCVV